VDRRPLTHGTRRMYQAGCPCLQCRRAEASYRTHLRQQRAKGQTPLGAYVLARSLWRLVKKLTAEGFTRPEIALRLGLKRPRLELHTTLVRQSSVVKVQAFYDLIMAEGPELPCSIESISHDQRR
jgi:hypothetical protein